MHGLVNRAFEGFLGETYGPDVWDKVRSDAGLDFERFETMLKYHPTVTERVMLAACYRLDKPLETLLEDVGTWIVTNPKSSSVRRLLRFGGTDFRDFLFSLDELPGRIKMAIPDLAVPQISLREKSAGVVELILAWPHINLSGVFLGAIRAISDDYGALVLMEAHDTAKLTTVIDVELLDNSFAEGSDFQLGGVANE